MYKRLRKLFLNHIPTLIKTGILYKMPSLYSFLEIKPSSCTIMITNRCNMKCIMCKQWQEEPKVELQTEDWKRIIKDLRDNGIRNIHFTGGEPLLRNDLQELVSYSCQSGFVVGLTTNGVLLRREILQDLIDAGLRSIAVSIDALDSEYEKVRGVPNSFSRAKEAVSSIAEMRKKKKIDAYINFTLMNNTIGEFENVKKFADELQMPVAVCLLDKNSSIFDLEENERIFWIKEDGDFKRLQELLYYLKDEKIKRSNLLLLNFPMIEFIGRYFRDPRQSHIPCVSSQDRIIVDPYGNLLGGCLTMGSFGNIKEKPFSELQKEGRYKRAKESMFYKKCVGCSCGYQFNIRCFPDLVVKDLLTRIKYFCFGGRDGYLH